MDIKTFWQTLEVTDPDRCWLWPLARHEKGYGIVYIEGVRWKTHRLAWSLVNGPIPEGVQIRHFKCDNPPCGNPHHLRPGTNQDNVNDMMSRDRNSPPPNMAGWNKIELPAAIIELIGTMPDYQLAIIAGVSKRTIARNRHTLEIQSYADRTGNSGKFPPGFNRWSNANRPPCRPEK